MCFVNWGIEGLVCVEWRVSSFGLLFCRFCHLKWIWVEGFSYGVVTLGCFVGIVFYLFGHGMLFSL